MNVMETNNSINIQKIEFSTIENTANIFCNLKNTRGSEASEMIIEQRILNRIINRIQAACSENNDEILDLMDTKKVDSENCFYTIDL